MTSNVRFHARELAKVLCNNSGADVDYIRKSDANGKTTLEFDYTIAAGENSNDLTVNSFNLNNAVLKETLDNNVELTMSVETIPNGQNLSDNNAIIIDTTDPTITITSAEVSNGFGNKKPPKFVTVMHF